MKNIFKENRFFLLPYFILFLLSFAALVISNKSDIHIFLNQHHNLFFDSFFYYATFLGDGLTATLVIIMFIAIKFRFFLIVGLSNIVAAGITQILKHTVFAEVYRPKKFFEGIYNLYFVPGVDNYLFYSFPSGHSTCAFAMYFSFALIVKSNKLKFLFFILAVLAGYSRIYLSQHFLQDVIAGSFIGLFCAFCFYLLFYNNQNRIMEKSIVTLFKNE